MQALNDYLAEPGRTGKALAAALNVNHSLICHWRVGRRKPSPAMARKLSAATRIPLSKIRPDIWPRNDKSAAA